MQVLTPSQTKALQLAADGLKVSQIAESMDVSVRTVEAHLAAAREALEARNTTQAVAKGIRGGIIKSVIFVVLFNSVSMNYPMDMRRPVRTVTRITRTIRRNEV